MKKIVILLCLIVATGAIVFGQKEEKENLYTLEIEESIVLYGDRNVIPKVQKNFFLIYDSIDTNSIINWEELKIRETHSIPKKLQKAQKKFLRAYKFYKRKQIVFHEDMQVQKTFDDNVNIIYNIITNELFQYGNNTEITLLIFYLEDFAFALKGKSDTKDENFISNCYCVYCNADIALLNFFTTKQ